MLRKSCLYLLLVLFYFSEGYGQDKYKVDSLTHLFQNTTQDTTKVSALLSLAVEYYLSNPDTAIVFCGKALLIAETADLKVEMADCYAWLSYLVKQVGDISKALEYNFKSIKIYEDLVTKKKLRENLEEKTFLESQKMLKKGLAVSYNNSGLIYDEQGEIEKALEYYFLSLKIEEEIKNKKGMATSYNNIGSIYYNQGETDRALKYYFLCLKIKEEIKDKLGMAMSYRNIGSALGILDSLAEGMRYLELGLKVFREWEDKVWISVSLSTIGGLQLEIGQVEAALKSGLEAMAVAKEVGHVEYIKRAARLLNKVYRKQGKFEDALAMYELEITMRDSIVNEENTKSTIRQQMKYDYEKAELLKEQEEKEQLRLATEAQSRRDDLHYAGIFIGMFLLFGVVLMLGFVKVPPKGAEAIIFLSFLILFEFLLVLLDPFVDKYTGGAPIFKLILNAVLAGLIFPLHQYFEKKLKKKLVKGKRNSPPLGGVGGGKEVKALMFLGLVFIHPLLIAMPDGRQAQTDTTSDQMAPSHLIANHKDLSANRRIDSLKLAYEVAEHDTTRINILFAMGDILIYFNPDTALIIEEKIKDICIKNLNGKMHLKTENIFKQALGEAFHNIGFIHEKRGEIPKALKYSLLSLKINEEIKNYEGIAYSYLAIGLFYEKQKEVIKALEYYLLSKNIVDKIQNKVLIAITYNNIGGIYLKQGKIQQALEYTFLSLKIREESNDKKRVAKGYNNVGSMLCDLDSIDSGMRYLELGLKINRELGYKAEIASNLLNIGSWQLKLGLVEAALKSGLEALMMAKAVGHVNYLQWAGQVLSKVYKKQGKFKDALAMYELEIQMRDSILNEENTKATIRQQMKYEHEKEQIIKEQQEIEQARIQAEITSRRDNLQHSAIFIGILMLFGGVLMLGFVKVRPKDVEGIIFISFLILFEFVLVLADPHIEQYTGDAPGYKLLFNAGIAGLMFPLHQFFEGKLKKRIIKAQRKKIRERMKQYKKDVEGL